MIKRFLAIFLTVALVLGCFPVMATAEEEKVMTEADYAGADALFEAFDKLEATHATRNTAQSQITDAAEALVEASESYVEDSLVRKGDAFTWETTNGIRCVYSPRMRQIEENMTPGETGGEDVIYNEPAATRGGWPSGNQVYLIGPYYGYDSDFTDQYKNEAKRIATAIGDTDGYTLYSGKNATVDKVAEAVAKGAVVFFDSHGSTDYESGYDYVTGATSSYLCLTSTTGLTSADYDDGALYYSSGIFINGATIANHMKSQSPGGILWMAICLGMATNTMCDPLREMGVEVVCGYSQSVTFAGDYLFENAFWDKMCEGQTVAQASSYMKTTWGNWDWSTKIAKYYGYSDGYDTISAARADYAAFPVVVSDEDTHPGQRNKNIFYGADSQQTVRSTYTLFSQYNITATSSNASHGTVSVNGSTITAVPATGYAAVGCTVLSGSATVTQNGNTFHVQAASDCSIQIHFSPKQSVTVTFRGQETTQKTGYSGDPMTLPTPTAPEGYTFQGWAYDPMEEASTTKPSVMTGSFVPTANTTLYAVYSYVEEGTSSGSGDYVKLTTTPQNWEGEYLIVYEGSRYIFDGTLSSFDKVSNYKAVTISGNTISAAQGDPYKFTIEAYSGGYAIKGTSGNYIGNASNSNALTTSNSPLKNTLSMGADGTINIKSSGGSYLRFNNNSGQYRFRYYKSSSYTGQKAICLYVKDGSVGTVMYTTLGQCTHETVINGICTSCQTAFAARTETAYYETLQEAIDNAGGGVVQLLTDADTAANADVLRLDVNGYLLSSLTANVLYGFDSSATAYTEGRGGILNFRGAAVQDHIVNGTRYITLNEDGFCTFHVLEMMLDTVSLRTGETGLYYQGSIACDDTLRGEISGYGIALSTVDMPGIDYREAHNLYTENTGAPEDVFASVMVSGILKKNAPDNDSRGKQAIYANAYLELADGTVLLSDNTSADTRATTGFDGMAMSLYEMMTLLDYMADALPENQLTALQNFCSTWQDPMAAWQLTNLTN